MPSLILVGPRRHLNLLLGPARVSMYVTVCDMSKSRVIHGNSVTACETLCGTTVIDLRRSESDALRGRRGYRQALSPSHIALWTGGARGNKSDLYDLKGHLHLPHFTVSRPHHDQCAGTGTATSKSHPSASGPPAFTHKAIPPGICARVVHERLV